MPSVDINTATREELAEVNGIGEALAAAIVDYRDAHGPFQAVDDLLNVRGVSAGLLTKIRSQLTASAPSSRSLDVLVKKAAAQAPGDYTGHRVDVAGAYLTGDDRERVPFVAGASLTSDGRAILEILSRRTLAGSVTVRVLAPDGTVLASRAEDGPTLPQQMTLTVNPKVYGTTQPNEDPAAGKPARLRGQVVDAAGRRTASGLQVVIWGADAATPQDADFRALIVVTTDVQGHFNGPYPLGTFTSAHATVGLESGPVPVPIHLEQGEFPATVILVVDLPEPASAAADGCGCQDGSQAPRSPDATDLGRADGTFSTDAGAGRCADFTKPDRTLEEYAFSYVVRTTEPEIRGLVLDEPRKVPASVVGTFLPGLLAESPTAITTAAALPAPTVTRPALLAGSVPGVVTRAPDLGATITGTDNAAVARINATGINASPAGINAAGAAAIPALEGHFDATVLRSLSRDPATFTIDTVASAAKLSLHGDLIRYLGRAVAREPGRQPLTGDNPIDWDDDPTIYHATTIAHGHLLRFKQEWVADGYSMGNLLYSLPLAPGQKKQTAVIDWERRESATREEYRASSDSLEALVDRDRDISDIVSGTLTESTRGGSSASTGSFAAGLGIGAIIGPVGGLLGIGGGTSSANSTAWQDSSRQTSANALNQLRDRTIQSASSVRTQRTSVVSTVAQGERVSATTESVANYNHCHAITVQYFEVLRHLLIRQRLTDVQECLLVPMLMSWFTRDKALRWRNTLAGTVPLRLRGGFDALERIDANYVGSDLPAGRCADENLDSVEGELTIRFQLTRPADKDNAFDPAAWNPLLKLFGFSPADFYDQYLKDQAFQDRVFLQQLGPRIAGTVVQSLQVWAVRTDESAVSLRLDPTLLSTFVNDRALSVTLRMTGALPAVLRSDIKAVTISSRLNLPGLPFVIDTLPVGSRVIVESGSLRYRTAHLSDALFSDAYIRNDLSAGDDVRIETPLGRPELRNPREEDKELARNLLDHLNENIERFHHVLWGRMSDARRYMLLDGFVAPNSGGRSVASVVENELVGIAGNCLVMPVARGFHLDPTYRQDAENPIDLLEHYQPNTPVDPSRIAIPTRGVYAEAVMGACNSCEVIDETRFWRWSEEPVPDSPTQILPVSTDSRRAAPLDTTPTALPSPIIAMQNAPAAPDPAGLSAALSLLGQSGAFRDITGLQGNQQNAAAALQGAFQTATTFGTKAADLALQGKMSKDIDKAVKTIQAAKDQGLIDDGQASALTETAIRGMVGAGTTNPKESSTTADVEELTRTAGSEQAAVSVTRPTGEKIDVDAKPASPDGVKPIIILTGDTASADTRAFRPSANDKTLVIDVEATFRNAPDGASLRWSAPKAGVLVIDNPASARTRVRGVTPGRQDLDVELLDAGGVRIASMKLKLSVPQCVTITKDAAAFAQALSDAQLAGQENDVVADMKRTVENLLAKANARVFWQVGGLSEAVPAHVPAANVVVATLQNADPGGDMGRTTSAGAADTFNETITLFPGTFALPDTTTDLDTETQALIIQLQTSLPGNAALLPIAVKVYGRLIGETAAHEIGHALLWDDIPGDGHNSPSIPNDIMNHGVGRTFEQRTGMENTVKVSPVLPEHYVDHGLNAIDRFQAANQGLIDAQWPVPPALG
jgi:competence ComEA-like helix-hairpin-helix protein